MATTEAPIELLVELRNLEASTPDRGERALALDRALRAAVRAVLPGRQQKSNLDPLLAAARTAFVRALKRKHQAKVDAGVG